MALWRGKTGVPAQGPGVHLKYKVLSGGDNWADSATAAVGDSRAMLSRVLGALANGWRGLNDDQQWAADYFFMLGGTPLAGSDLDIVRQTLQLTANGLNGATLNLKLTVNGSALGYVNKHDSRFGLMEKLREKTGTTKKSWTPNYDVRGKTHVLTRRGDIHLDTSALDKSAEFGALVLIHEATHKFAGTADFSYIYEDTLEYENPMDKAKCLNNADSYAYFVYMAASAG